MRKLLNKKGFSLVELMIVVVIMGILIAVAIPLYQGVQDTAKRNTCKNNQRDVRAVYANYILTGESKSINTLFLTSDTEFNGKTDDAETFFDVDFLNKFSDGVLPTCPEENHYYVINKVGDNIMVRCVENGIVDGEHSEDE